MKTSKVVLNKSIRQVCIHGSQNLSFHAFASFSRCVAMRTISQQRFSATNLIPPRRRSP